MKSIQIFDPAPNRSSGTDASEALAKAAADLDWAQQQGARVERFDLARQPLAFTDNATVKSFIERSGEDALPLVLVDGEVALAGRYPNRSELAQWSGLEAPRLKVKAGDCCSGGNCG